MFLDKIISKLVNWYMWPVYVNCLMCLHLVRFLTGHPGFDYHSLMYMFTFNLCCLKLNIYIKFHLTQ